MKSAHSFFCVPPTRSRRVVPSSEAHGRIHGNEGFKMNLYNIFEASALSRIVYLQYEIFSGLFSIFSAYRASWVFLRKSFPCTTHRKTGVPNSKLCSNRKKVRRRCGAQFFKCKLVWYVLARTRECKGPYKKTSDGRPAGSF